MAIVEIADASGSEPIRIEIVGSAANDVREFYEKRDTRRIASKSVTKITRQLYEEAIGLACSCAAQTWQRIDALDEVARPDEFEVAFALSVDMEAGAKIVTLGSGGQVQVRMQWDRRTGA